MWEELLSDNFGNENVFRLDPFQRLFFSRSTIHIVIQALLMAIITFTLLRIYDYATILQV